MSKPLVSIIILSYNSRRFIEKCLDSVLRQDYLNWEALIIINGSEDGSVDLIRSQYGSHKKIRVLEPRENLWYSRGNNLGIRESKGDYILALNQDTILERDFLSRMINAMERDPRLGSATGKLLHYKFDIDSKTKIIDSTGIEMFRTRRVIDRGQWEVDAGQYDGDKEVFGASGAGAVYRKSALEEVKIPKDNGEYEYFDEDFTAYKEDVDLSWRLQLLGFACQYVPLAVMYHGRMVGRSWPTQFVRFIINRSRQPRAVRRLSFKNHYLMMLKNELPGLFWRHFIYIFFREVLLLVYTVMFEQFQIFAIRDFFRQAPRALRKRKIIMAKVRVDTSEISRLFD